MTRFKKFTAYPAWLFLVVLACGCFDARADTSYLSWYFDFANGTVFQSTPPNSLTSSTNNTIDGITMANSVTLAQGKISELNAGTVDPSFGSIDSSSQSYMGDTVTAAGNLQGFNLGVNVTVNGTTSFSDPAQNLTFLSVYALQVGSFDQASFLNGKLFGEGFVLGSGTMPYAADFDQFGLTYGGSFGDGTHNIPISIPFATLGSSFELLVTLQSNEVGDSSTGSIWSSDFSHTVSLSLSAPQGVTLTSASGVLPGTSAVPEPGQLPILLGAAVVLMCARKGFTKYARAS